MSLKVKFKIAIPQMRGVLLRKKAYLLLMLNIVVSIIGIIYLNEIYTDIAQRAGVTVLWSNKLEGYVQKNIDLAYIDNRFVLIIPSEKNVYAINTENGKVLWSFTASNYITSTSTITKASAKNEENIVVGDDAGNVYLLDGYNGSLIWKKSLAENTSEESSIKELLSADLNGDRIPEIIVCSNSKLYIMNENNGSIIWYKNAGPYVLIYDVNQDGFSDIITYGTFKRNVSALDGLNGNLLWRSNISIPWSAAILDVDEDGKPEIIGNSGEIIDATTGILEEKKSIVFSSPPVLGDLNNDGHEDLVAEWMGTDLYAYDLSSGKLLWKFSVSTPFWTYLPPFTGPAPYPICPSPSIGDVDGNNKLDVIAAMRNDGTIYVFSGAKGTIIWKFKTDSSVIWTSPKLADIDNDGRMEVLVVSLSGTVYALKSKVTK